MKTYILKSSSEVPPVLPRFPALRKRLAAASADAAPAALSLGADGLLTRAEGTALVRELTAGGHRVAAGVEACGFGWKWQGELRACVRLLFIDLWRLHTGRATLAGLGFKGRPDGKAPGPEKEPEQEEA